IATGACVVPVDPNLPDEEAGRLLDDLRVAALVSSDAGAPIARRAEGSGIPTLPATADPDGQIRLGGALLSDPSSPILPDLDADAWILHTSGTTGRPRRVPWRHRHLIPVRSRLCADYGFAADDVAL